MGYGVCDVSAKRCERQMPLRLTGLHRLTCPSLIEPIPEPPTFPQQPKTNDPAGLLGVIGETGASAFWTLALQ